MVKMKNNRGWIRIVEAFIAILLVAGVLLVVINRGYIGKADISDQVYETELAVLREIQLDGGLRIQILNADIEGNVPVDIVNKINERIPDYLTCKSKICELEVICEMDKYIDKDVYAQAVAIATEGDNPNFRQLKLFCWTD